jgi:O-antigen/teichoic acid export membrane protein
MKTSSCIIGVPIIFSIHLFQCHCEAAFFAAEAIPGQPNAAHLPGEYFGKERLAVTPLEKTFLENYISLYCFLLVGVERPIYNCGTFILFMELVACMFPRLQRVIFSQAQSLREKGFFHLLTANALTQALSFGITLFISKVLSPAEFGNAKILQSYFILFMVLAGSAFNPPVLKYCAEDRAPGNREFILRYSLVRSLATTALALTLMIALSYLGIITSSRTMAFWLIIYGVAMPFTVVTDIFYVYLQALRRMKKLSHAQVINRLLMFVLVVLGTWQWGLPGFVVGTVAACALGVLYPGWQVGLRFLKATAGNVPPRLYALALFSLLNNMATNLGQYGDMFILDHLVSDRQAIGFYSLATYFILAATQITITIQAILIPHFSRHGHERAWFDKNLRQYQILTIGLSLPVAATIWGVSWLLVRFVYGDIYQPTLSYLFVLMLRYLIFSGYAVIAAALIGLGLVRLNFISTLFATLAGLLLAYWLQFDYGVLGVAWAQAGAALINLGFMLFWVLCIKQRRFGSLQ